MARAIKQALDVPVIAVGNLDNPLLAEATLGNGDADLVAVGRGIAARPVLALHTIRTVSGEVVPPKQYELLLNGQFCRAGNGNGQMTSAVSRP